jgi:hypothetical protein
MLNPEPLPKKNWQIVANLRFEFDKYLAINLLSTEARTLQTIEDTDIRSNLGIRAGLKQARQGY